MTGLAEGGGATVPSHAPQTLRTPRAPGQCSDTRFAAGAFDGSQDDSEQSRGASMKFRLNYRAASLVLGLVLLVAAGLKGQQLTHDGAAGTPMGVAGWWLGLGTVLVEVVFGGWLM